MAPKIKEFFNSCKSKVLLVEEDTDESAEISDECKLQISIPEKQAETIQKEEKTRMITRSNNMSKCISDVREELSSPKRKKSCLLKNNVTGGEQITIQENNKTVITAQRISIITESIVGNLEKMLNKAITQLHNIKTYHNKHQINEIKITSENACEISDYNQNECSLHSKKKKSLSLMNNITRIEQNIRNENNKPRNINFTSFKKISSNIDRSVIENMSMNEIRNKINRSNKLKALKASINHFTYYNQRLNALENKKEKYLKYLGAHKSNCMGSEMLTNKIPTSQEFSSLSESTAVSLLPRNYKFLTELFNSIETAVAEMVERNEIITFTKLKQAVKKLKSCNLTLDHLAQIKTVYPDAYRFHSKKIRFFSSKTIKETEELILIPIVKVQDQSNNPGINVSISPDILLERKKTFYMHLLDMIKEKHKMFLQKLWGPMLISKKIILRWHPLFNVEICKPIEPSVLPKPCCEVTTTNIENHTISNKIKEVKSLFNSTSLEESINKSEEKGIAPTYRFSNMYSWKSYIKNIKQLIIMVDDDDDTDQLNNNQSFLRRIFKRIPKALYGMVEVWQAAKILLMMNRNRSIRSEYFN